MFRSIVGIGPSVEGSESLSSRSLSAGSSTTGSSTTGSSILAPATTAVTVYGRARIQEAQNLYTRILSVVPSII